MQNKHSLELNALAKEVNELFIERGFTLSVAESFTGGNVAAALVACEGTSKFLTESLVCYSNRSKELRLRVDKKTLESYGAVSNEVAREMVNGLLMCELAPNFAISTTGNASTAMSNTTVSGECYVAVGRLGTVEVRKLLLNGNREENIIEGACESLRMLLNFVKNL